MFLDKLIKSLYKHNEHRDLVVYHMVYGNQSCEDIYERLDIKKLRLDINKDHPLTKFIISKVSNTYKFLINPTVHTNYMYYQDQTKKQNEREN